MGEKFGCEKPDCRPGCDCDRYFELWNLVFPQYEKTQKGEMIPLANKGIDTGMGLERLAVAIQGAETIFDTDLFSPIIDEASRALGVSYSEDRIAFGVIADHIRALTFACTEGVMPSNEGRGYVLRRLLRRAARRGVSLGTEEPFLYRLVGTVTDVMREPYPELIDRREQVSLVIKSEEERFLRALGQGLAVFEEIISAGARVISGDDAFRLYDTYGFPIDMTMEMAREKGLEVDVPDFEDKMAAQRDRARAGSRFRPPDMGEGWEVFEEEVGAFVGHEITQTRSRITGWRVEDENVEIKLDNTPFYAEAGGQVGDTGRIYSDDFEVKVLNTLWTDQGIVHIGKLIKGEIRSGTVTAEVDCDRRKDIARNHTATHLLQGALRSVLGEHVRQEGSLVEPERLRFDFTHYNPMTQREIDRVEELVNSKIRDNLPVEAMKTSHEKATKEIGAIALFGEKYADEVRVIKIGDFSAELCGGTHLDGTGEMGLFKIASESAVAAGIRRIEVLTGRGAYDYIKKQEGVLSKVSDVLGSTIDDLEDKFGKFLDEQKVLKRRVRQLESKLASVMAVKLVGRARRVKGVKVYSSIVELTDMVGLREMADEARVRVRGKCVGVVGSVIEGKVVFVVFVTDDLTDKLKAGDVAKEVGKLIGGGGGGGKPTLAEAGGKDIKKMDEVIKRVPDIVKDLLKGA